MTPVATVRVDPASATRIPDHHDLLTEGSASAPEHRGALIQHAARDEGGKLSEGVAHWGGWEIGQWSAASRRVYPAPGECFSRGPHAADHGGFSVLDSAVWLTMYESKEWYMDCKGDVWYWK